MTVYVVATISIHDREGYDRYTSRFFESLKGTGGRLLAADDAPEVLEGDWSRDKVNIIAFPDRESCERWYTSDLYREISADRLASTEGTALLVHGLPSAGA